MQIEGFETIVEMDALLTSDDDDLLFRAADFRTLVSGDAPHLARTCEPLALETLASQLDTNSIEPDLFIYRSDSRTRCIATRSACMSTNFNQACDLMVNKQVVVVCSREIVPTKLTDASKSH